MPSAKNENEITIDVSKPVRDGTGGARDMGNVMVCDFDLSATTVEDIQWKPYMALNIEVGVLEKDDGSVLVFTRRRFLG